MTDPRSASDSHDLPELDATARTAASGLRHHVDQHVDVDLALASAPVATPARARSRIMALAAVVALLAGSFAVLQAGSDEGPDRLQVDEDGNVLPDPEPGVLTPLGPRDGKDTIQLPVVVEPNRDLADGAVVSVTSLGFVPGERVGIVQCASEAGGDSPETRGGIDGCNIGTVQYADADADGVATGTFTVQRVLTTPLTGTVDCAAEADRCLVAMGALNDYDRSGGHGIELQGGGEPIAIPEVTVSPAEGLRDGDVVEVSGTGLTPGDNLGFSVCSSDPSICWDTMPADGSSVRVDGEGRFTTQLPVWQFLPGSYEQPGTYVDCAVSRCSLRVYGRSTPPPALLGFLPGDGPNPPAVSIEPADGLAPGDIVVVRGAGFWERAGVTISLCATSPAPAEGAAVVPYSCVPFDIRKAVRTDAEGRFAVEAQVPDPASWGGSSEVCDSQGECHVEDIGMPAAFACDDAANPCQLVIEQYAYDEATGRRPSFSPAPVPVTFR